MKVRKMGRLAAGALAIAMVASCTSERAPMVGMPAGNGSAGGGSAAGGEKFGTLASPCGAGDAKGATDQGVTDDSIAIGFGDDRGFASAPGLSKEMGDAVAAMIDWCNEQGGINGRKIVGHQYDAAYTQAPQVMQEACKQDFMLVGQGFAMDESAEQFRVACKLPTVAGYTVGPNAAMGPMKYEAVPYPVDLLNVGGLVIGNELFSDFEDKTDLLLSTSPAVTAGTNKIASAMKGMGIEPMECGVRLNNSGESSYMPFAQKVADCGVEYLWSSDTPDTGQFSLLESIQRAGAEPKFIYEATWYSTAVAEWNKGGAGDRIHAAMIFQPFENADKAPAVEKYMDLVGERDGKIALLGMQATSAFLLWATAADACGSDLTRQCVINELSQVHEWTGGGLHAPTDPGANKPAECALMVKLTGSEWEQIYPKERGEFECGEQFVVETDPKTWGAELNDDRISTKFLTDDVIKPRTS